MLCISSMVIGMESIPWDLGGDMAGMMKYFVVSMHAKYRKSSEGVKVESRVVLWV